MHFPFQQRVEVAHGNNGNVIKMLSTDMKKQGPSPLTPVSTRPKGVRTAGKLHPLLDASTGHVADIAHEVIYRLKEGNSTKWLFSSSLTVPGYVLSLISPLNETQRLVWS
jgi:hypothetical protein